MSDKSLIKKSTWELSLDEFNAKILKEVYLNPLIPEAIRLEVENINALLLHSYYNSNFIDDAYTKAIFILEKVLRIRSKDLNNGMKDVNLASLFEWFFEKNYFETTDINELHRLRTIRNKKVHDSEIFNGSLKFLLSIYSIFDLMNDVYEDVDLRLKRREKTKKINEEISSLCKNGFILEVNGLPYFGHFASVSFYNNKPIAEALHLRIARCIESEVAHLGADRDNYALTNWSFDGQVFKGQLKTGESIQISPLSNPKHIDQFQNWLDKYSVWTIDLHGSLERNCYEEKLREFHKLHLEA